MSFQTCKTFFHLWNTNEDILDEIRELSGHPYKGTTTVKAQKGIQDIVKLVHLTSVVQR